MGSPTISFAKYPYLLRNHRAHESLVMRSQFGLALNTIDAYARALSSYFAFSEKLKIAPELSNCLIPSILARHISHDPSYRIASLPGDALPTPAVRSPALIAIA